MKELHPNDPIERMYKRYVGRPVHESVDLKVGELIAILERLRNAEIACMRRKNEIAELKAQLEENPT